MEDKRKDNVLYRVLNLIIERWWIALLTVIIGMLAAFTLTRFVLPKEYSSAVLIFANSSELSSQQITTTDISVATSLLRDYRVLAKSRTLIDSVNKSLAGVDHLPAIISSDVTVATEGESRGFVISVKTRNPMLSYKAVGYIATDLSKMVENKYNLSIDIIDPAVYSDDPVSPNMSSNMLFGIVLGLLAGVLIMYLIFLFDRRIKTVEDFEMYFDHPVLGIIPEFDNDFFDEKVKSAHENKT